MRGFVLEARVGLPDVSSAFDQRALFVATRSVGAARHRPGGCYAVRRTGSPRATEALLRLWLCSLQGLAHGPPSIDLQLQWLGLLVHDSIRKKFSWAVRSSSIGWFRRTLTCLG